MPFLNRQNIFQLLYIDLGMHNSCVPTMGIEPDLRTYSINGLLGIPSTATTHSVHSHPMQHQTPIEASSAFNPMYPYSKPLYLSTNSSVSAYSHQTPQGYSFIFSRFLYRFCSFNSKTFFLIFFEYIVFFRFN